MRLIITGSRGFLGGSIGRLAASNGHQILGIDRSAQAAPGWPGKYIQNDMTQSDLSTTIRDFMPDVLFHAAGPASVKLSFTAPFDDFQESIATWSNVLESVRRSKLDPLLIFPSSAAVYGIPAKLPVREDAVIAPISPYGFHKAACELLAREYSECFGLNIVTCRFFSIFGPDQRRLLIWELYHQFIGAESTVWLDGSGKEFRDYLAIDDAAAALFQLICKLRQRRQNGHSAICKYQVINIASGEDIEIFKLAQKVGEILASKKPIRCRGNERRGEPGHWRADISRLRSFIPSWDSKPLALSLSECLTAWQRGHDPFAAHL
jgi:UDP-glucose 4-epimerase